MDPFDLTVKQKIAYVGQEDLFFQTATPREAIQFSARLRLPSTTSDDEMNHITQSVLKQLNLSRVADSIIFNGIAGISGGERRRTSLGMELVTKPSIVLLDEITSGLDSYNAVQVLETLKQVTMSGTTVLFTMHQPNRYSSNLVCT